MKVLLPLAALVLVAGATFIPTSPHVKQGDDAWYEKQTKVHELLSWGKMKEAYQNEFYDWDIENQADSFKCNEVYSYFLKQYREGFFPRDASFNHFCPKSVNQTRTLYELFYVAKDFDTFYKTASWARKHVNFEAFVYAFSVAVFTRPDCKGIQIPPFYEIFPTYFVPSDTMHKAYKAKLIGNHVWKAQFNYSGFEYSYHSERFDGVFKQFNEAQKSDEYKLSYFREDVALNDFYARWFLHYPSWLNTERYYLPDWPQRGELFYYFHQQLFARYTLERFANGLPAPYMLQWNRPIPYGFNPKLITDKGIPMSTRPDYFNLEKFYPRGVWRAQDLERKLINSIDGKLFYLANNTIYKFKEFDAADFLGKAVSGMPDGVSKFYGNYYMESLKTLTYGVKTNSDKHFVGGPTGYMFTSLRDPAFYSYLHRMLKFFYFYKNGLPTYTPEQVGYPGVKIESFDVDKLLTYFEFYDFDISYGLSLAKNEEKKEYNFVARQPRINHKPFNYKFTISSEKSEDAMIRVFIGPKYDSEGREMTIEQSRLAYFEMDRFPVKLTAGQNSFERSSKDSTVFAKEQVSSFKGFKEYIAKFGKNYHESFQCGFPEHMQLPMGKKSGMPYIMFAIVTPYTQKYTPKSDERYYEAFVTCGGSKFYDYKPFGFPFDRPVPYFKDFYTPNMYFKNVEIFHKDDHDFAFKSDQLVV